MDWIETSPVTNTWNVIINNKCHTIIGIGSNITNIVIYSYGWEYRLEQCWYAWRTCFRQVYKVYRRSEPSINDSKSEYYSYRCRTHPWGISGQGDLSTGVPVPSVWQTLLNEVSRKERIFVIAFPTIYPRGQADFNAPMLRKVGLEDYAWHLTCLTDQRFAWHPC